jgi:hypothetical protein
MKEHATIELDTVIVAEIADGVVPESGSECEDVISVSLRRGNRRRCRPGGMSLPFPPVRTSFLREEYGHIAG